MAVAGPLRRVPAWMVLVAGASLALPPGRALSAQAVAPGVTQSGDSVLIHFADADLRSVVGALGQYLPKPIMMGDLPASRASLDTPHPVPAAMVPALLSGLLASKNLSLVEDTAFFRLVPKTGTAAPQVPAKAVRDTQPTMRLFVIRLKHARAADVAATVTQLFGGGGEFSGGSGPPSNTLSDELQRDAVPPVGAAPDGSRAAAAAAPAGANLSNHVTIVPDALTNSLLIRSTATDFSTISAAVDELDIRPLQVLIEVLIVEARHDRTFSLGNALTLPEQQLGHSKGTVAGTLAGGGLGDVVVQLMHLGKPDIDAVLSTAEEKGDVKIVSRPVLLASNNVEARFLVGTQRPFVQVSRSLPTDTPSRDQVVQYRNVGTQLTVKPTINQDGYVSLQIQQEIDAATNETQFDAPVISTREAVTQVLVKNRQTIVIGGLRDRQTDRTSSGVPLLSGIPIIGGLFGGTSRRTESTELFLFITPTILASDADADSVTAPRLPQDSAQ